MTPTPTSQPACSQPLDDERKSDAKNGWRRSGFVRITRFKDRGFLGMGRTNPGENNHDQQTPHELIPSFVLLIPSSLTDPMGHCPISPLMPPQSHVTLRFQWVNTSGPRLCVWGFSRLLPRRTGSRVEHHSQDEDSVSPHSARHACHAVSSVSHPQTSPFPKCKQPRLGELSVD